MSIIDIMAIPKNIVGRSLGYLWIGSFLDTQATKKVVKMWQ